MQQQIIMFQTLISNFLESFSPHFINVLEEFEMSPSKGKSNIIKIFPDFPRSSFDYNNILKSLSDVASCNPNDIIRYIGKLLKETIQNYNNTPLSSVYSASHTFDHGNENHRLLLYYFSIFFLSDLIFQILVKYKVQKSNSILARAGFNFANNKSNIRQIDKFLIDQWAVIYSLISRDSCQEITDLFHSFEDPHTAIQLLKYLRLDKNQFETERFLPILCTEMQKMHRKKILKSDDFEALSHLIFVLPINEEFFSKIFDIAYSYRSDKDSCNGATLLCLEIILKWPKKRSLLNHLIEKRIFMKAEAKDQLLHALKGLQRYMLGSKINVNWLFYSWGNSPFYRPLEFLEWASLDELGISDQDHYNKIFVKYYFSKINYEIGNEELKLLSNIILHLSSINFKSFVKNLMPIFLKLKDTDFRFIAFIQIISKVNLKDFLTYSYCKIKDEHIISFNEMLHDRIISLLLKYEPDDNNSVVFEAKDLFGTNHIKESDQQITEILNDWDINDFDCEFYKLRQTKNIANDLTFNPPLASSLEFILKNEDCQNVQILSKIIEMSFDHNRVISSAAFDLCKTILKQEENIKPMLEALKFEIQNRMTPESLFVIETILFYAISCADTKKLDKETLLLFESEAFLCLCSCYPMLRHVSFHILRKINQILNNKGLLFYVATHQQEIEENVKLYVMCHAPPKMPIPRDLLDEYILNMEANQYLSSENNDFNEEISEETQSTEASVFQPSKFSIQLNKIHRLSDIAKEKIIIKNKMSSQTVIKFDICMLSNYYSLWLMFIQTIINTLININYIPLFKNLNLRRKSILECYPKIYLNEWDKNKSLFPSAVGFVTPCLSALYYYPIMSKYQTIYSSQKASKEEAIIYAPFDKNDLSDNRKYVYRILKKWIDNGNVDLCKLSLECIGHLHFSLIPKILPLLSHVKNELFGYALHSMMLILFSLQKSSRFIRSQSKKLLQFVSNAQYIISEMQLNGPRQMIWTKEIEYKTLSNFSVIKDFCAICEITFNNLKSENIDDIWPQEQRQVTSRFFLNWQSCKSSDLEIIKLYSSKVLEKIVKLGPLFTDSLLFDQNTSNIFGKMDVYGLDVLHSLLSYNYEQLLGNFIDAFFFDHHPISNYYFSAIIDNMTEPHSHYSSLLSGPLLFLGLVAEQVGNNQSHQFIENFLKAVGPVNNVSDIESILNSLRNAPLREVLPNYFKYATEAVFSTFFRIVKSPSLVIPVKTLVESILPWVKQIRLLPSQTTCAQGVTNLFAFFTPYQFLVNLMQATEEVSEINFSFMASIWTELLKIQDHTTLIPNFIESWKNQKTMKSIYSILLNSMPLQMCQKAVSLYSFAYYFHILSCHSIPGHKIQDYIDFQKELWMTPLIIPVFKNNWNNIVRPKLPQILHFSFLFRDSIPQVFAMLCEKFSIAYPNPQYELTDIEEVLQNFIFIMKNLNDLSDQPKENNNFLYMWADESLKWAFASPNLKYSTLSFYIFMKIDEDSQGIIPYDENLLHSLIRAVSFQVYNITENSCNFDLLTMLVGESFNFINRYLNSQGVRADGNILKLAFNYCSCFVDCPVFVDNSLSKAIPIFQAALAHPDLINNIKNIIISIIRPIISKLEVDNHYRKIFQEFATKFNSSEMKIIIVPLKRANPTLFSELPSATEILEEASISNLCKALVHYSLMIKTASQNLLNYIFEVSAHIVSKIQDDNNCYNLSKIYSIALRNVSVCPKAIDFIKVLAIKQPTVLNVNPIDICEWYRSIDDVAKDVSSKSKPIESISSIITECPNYQSVLNFLFSEIPPKILPFESNHELIDNFIKVEKPKTTRKTFALPKATRNVPLSRALIKQDAPEIVNSLSELSSLEDEWTPLQHPSSLIINSKEFEIPTFELNIGSKSDFLKNEKTSQYSPKMIKIG